MKRVIGLIPLVDDERDSLWMLPGYMEGVAEAGGLPLMLPLTEDVPAPRPPQRPVRRLSADRRPRRVPRRSTGNRPCLRAATPPPGGTPWSWACCAGRWRLTSPCWVSAGGYSSSTPPSRVALWQDLPSQHPSDGVPPAAALRRPPPPRSPCPVRRWSDCCGSTLAVNSYHHQAIRGLARPSGPWPWPRTGSSRPYGTRGSAFCGRFSGTRSSPGGPTPPPGPSFGRSCRPAAEAT